MTIQRSPFGLLAATIVLIAAYLVTAILFAMGAALGFGICLAIPIWLAVPPMLRGAHELASSLAAPRALRKATVVVEAMVPAHSVA